MSKNIVICCDGTGNEFKADGRSNVVKLYSTLVINADQVGYYHPGVGTMGAPSADTWLGKKWTQLLGLGIGRGLLEDVGRAYGYLMETYADGDHIFLFGFSRGAYTVRAVAGMLHMFGLLCPGNEGLIPYVTRMFARHTREALGTKQTLKMADDFKQTFSREVIIHFVGVWDTVSSVGWVYDPVVLPYSARNPIMRTGRHAVSIDEHRAFFRNNLWGAPFQPGDPDYRVDQDIRQVWFAGVHSDVGGSYAELESGLSKIALEWMLTQARIAGLIIDDDKAKNLLPRVATPTMAAPDPKAQIHESLTPAWWGLELLPRHIYDRTTGKRRWTIPLGARRQIPAGSLVHQTVQDRIDDKETNYHPSNLPQAPGTEPWIRFP